MNARQQRFVDEYLIDLNATQAAIRAGYSQKTAYSIGQENLKKPEIKAAVEKALAKGSEDLGITRDYVLGRLRDNLERSMQLEQVLDHKGKPTGEYRYEGSVANRSAELLGKHLGMFVDRSEVEVKTLPATEREQRVLTLLRTAKQRKVAG